MNQDKYPLHLSHLAPADFPMNGFYSNTRRRKGPIFLLRVHLLSVLDFRLMFNLETPLGMLLRGVPRSPRHPPKCLKPTWERGQPRQASRSPYKGTHPAATYPSSTMYPMGLILVSSSASSRPSSNSTGLALSCFRSSCSRKKFAASSFALRRDSCFRDGRAHERGLSFRCQNFESRSDFQLR